MIGTVIASSILILLILIFRKLFGKYLHRRMIYSLWLIVAVRLLILPFVLVPDNISFMNVFQYSLSEITEKTGDIVINPVPKIVGDTDERVNESSTSEVNQSFSTRITIDEILKVVWIVGMLITMLIFFVPLIRFWHNIRKKRMLYEKVQNKRLVVYTIEGLPTPCLVWHQIYLPHKIIYDDEQYKYAMLHEMTHYKHADHLWNMLRILILCVYWFHPLVWVAVFISKKDSEFACDEGVVLRLEEEERTNYCQALLEIATNQRFCKSDLLMESGMTEGNILTRIKFLTEPPIAKKGMAILVIIVLLLCSATSLSTRADSNIQVNDTTINNYSIYPMSQSISVVNSEYHNNVLSIKFSNVSKSTYLLYDNELEYYDEESGTWMRVLSKVSGDDNNIMFAIQPDTKNDELPLGLSSIQKEIITSQVFYSGDIKIDFTSQYDDLQSGKYRILFIFMDEGGTKEILYDYFE